MIEKSILDLPEPERSEALKLFGMTKEEFRQSLEDSRAEDEWIEAEIKAGRYTPVKMHYDDDPEGYPDFHVVEDWEPPGGANGADSEEG